MLVTNSASRRKTKRGAATHQPEGISFLIKLRHSAVVMSDTKVFTFRMGRMGSKSTPSTTLFAGIALAAT